MKLLRTHLESNYLTDYSYANSKICYHLFPWNILGEVGTNAHLTQKVYEHPGKSHVPTDEESRRPSTMTQTEMLPSLRSYEVNGRNTEVDTEAHQ